MLSFKHCLDPTKNMQRNNVQPVELVLKSLGQHFTFFGGESPGVTFRSTLKASRTGNEGTAPSPI